MFFALIVAFVLLNFDLYADAEGDARSEVSVVDDVHVESMTATFFFLMIHTFSFPFFFFFLLISLMLCLLFH